jgi:proline racemase
MLWSVMQLWNPPPDWRTIGTVDAHTAGEPLRIITSGVGPVPGDTILDKRAYARNHLDELRRILMWEPRGHADMYGAILTEPVTADGDAGVLFLHNEGFSTMCGHGIIALATVGVEAGWFGSSGEETTVRFDTPAGRVTATAHREDGVVRRVSFVNVPSFVLHHDAVVDVPGVGDVRCDIAYGGAFYAYVDAGPFGLDLTVSETEHIVDLGRRIKDVVSRTVPIEHPTGDPELGFLYGTIFVGRPAAAQSHSRNVCVFAEGEVDRSPTGTGVSGRLALLSARGALAIDEEIIVESILGSTFAGRVIGSDVVGGIDAVVPKVTGSAYVTGRHEFFVDPSDPLAAGFLIR